MHADHKRRIAGVLCIALAALTTWLGLAVAGVFFVIVGVSLIMDVRIWRS
jgi:hypothetical protein